MTATVTGQRAARIAARAVVVVFVVAGFVMASWLARIPAVRDALGVGPGELGLILLALSCGSVLALPSSGPVVHRFRPARSVLGAACLTTLALVGVGLGGSGAFGGVALLVPSLFLAGIGIGVWDVAMNLEGAEVEQRLGRAIMPWFHAAFSFGTVAGALSGAAAAALGLPLFLHLSVVAVLALAAVVWAVRDFLLTPPGDDEEDGPRGSGIAQAWRERRTLLIGVLVLGMALAEGAANDWLALGLVDGYGLSHAGGAIGLGVFLTAMTGCRLAGPWLLERFGRVPVLRGGAVLVLVGVALYVAAQALVDPDASLAGNALPTALALLAVVVWGLGAALGFPVGMSAAADDPRRAAARVSVVASIGYIAFLAGPPLLGFLADRVGTVQAMAAVGVAVALSLLAAGSAAPLPPVRRSPCACCSAGGPDGPAAAGHGHAD